MMNQRSCALAASSFAPPSMTMVPSTCPQSTATQTPSLCGIEARDELGDVRKSAGFKDALRSHGHERSTASAAPHWRTVAPGSRRAAGAVRSRPDSARRRTGRAVRSARDPRPCVSSKCRPSVASSRVKKRRWPSFQSASVRSPSPSSQAKDASTSSKEPPFEHRRADHGSRRSVVFGQHRVAACNGLDQRHLVVEFRQSSGGALGSVQDQLDQFVRQRGVSPKYQAWYGVVAGSPVATQKSLQKRCTAGGHSRPSCRARAGRSCRAAHDCRSNSMQVVVPCEYRRPSLSTRRPSAVAVRRPLAIDLAFGAHRSGRLPSADARSGS